MNKRKVLDYLNGRIKDLEFHEIYYNTHDNNDLINSSIQGLKNIKKIIERRLDEE
jgi:hypothetical protein